MKLSNPALAFSLLLLTGCADQLYGSLPLYLESKNMPAPTAQSFPHCQNYGCRVVKNVELSQDQWNTLYQTFGSKAKDAEEEREKITKTIAAFEKIVGPITGTDVDINGTFEKTGEGQLDCVDESSNTTIYLMLLKNADLLVFHDIEQPHVRYPIISGRGWMHQTAVITETKTGAQYAVDSWFGDNGTPPRIIPLEGWENGQNDAAD